MIIHISKDSSNDIDIRKNIPIILIVQNYFMISEIQDMICFNNEKKKVKTECSDYLELFRDKFTDKPGIFTCNRNGFQIINYDSKNPIFKLYGDFPGVVTTVSYPVVYNDATYCGPATISSRFVYFETRNEHKYPNLCVSFESHNLGRLMADCCHQTGFGSIFQYYEPDVHYLSSFYEHSIENDISFKCETLYGLYENMLRFNMTGKNEIIHHDNNNIVLAFI